MKKKLGLVLLSISTTIAFGQTPAANNSVSNASTTNNQQEEVMNTSIGENVMSKKPTETDEPFVSEIGLDNHETINGAYKKENAVNVKVMPYPYIRQADVMYAKRVWREIDLREKINKPLASPTKGIAKVLIDAIAAGELTAYKPPASNIEDIFKEILTTDEMATLLSGKADTIQYAPLLDDPSYLRDTVIYNPFNVENVVKVRLQEDWIFDKNRSVFGVRIVGIALLDEVRTKMGESLGTKTLLWVNFEEARQAALTAEVPDRFNDAAGLTYDALFLKRLFSSVIVQESRPDGLKIAEYDHIKGQNKKALFESEKIKKTLMDYEMALWEY